MSTEQINSKWQGDRHGDTHHAEDLYIPEALMDGSDLLAVEQQDRNKDQISYNNACHIEYLFPAKIVYQGRFQNITWHTGGECHSFE